MCFSMTDYTQGDNLKFVFAVISFVMVVMFGLGTARCTDQSRDVWQIAILNRTGNCTSSTYGLPIGPCNLTKHLLSFWASSIASLVFLELFGFVVFLVILFTAMIARPAICASPFFASGGLSPVVPTFLSALSTLCLEPAFDARFFSELVNRFRLSAFCTRFGIHSKSILRN